MTTVLLNMKNIVISFFSGIKDPCCENPIVCFYETIIESLRKSGNNVFVYIASEFSGNFEEIPPDLLKELKEFNSDVFFLFNNNFFDISDKFDCPIVIWGVDAPMGYSNYEKLKKNSDRYKYIVYSERDVFFLVSKFFVQRNNILVSPVFTEIRAEDVEKRNNISFIGSKFIDLSVKTPWQRFMEEDPEEDEKSLYWRMVNYCRNDPYISKKDLFDLFSVQSDLIKKQFNISDVAFYLSDKNRVTVLASIADLGLDLYGTPNWILDRYNEPDLISCYVKKHVYSLKHNQDVYNSTRIGININHVWARDGLPWRVCDIMASSACLVSEYKDDLKKYFKNLKIPTFTNIYDARSLCIKLLKNENLRLDTVAACNEVIDKSYRFRHARENIEDFLNIDLDGEGEGQVSYYRQEKKKKENKIKLKKWIRLYIYNKLLAKLKEKSLIE